MQFAGIVLTTAIAGLIRGVAIPRYKLWVAGRVASGNWTMDQAHRFNTRVLLAIWCPLFLILGAGLWWWFVLARYGIAT